MALMMASSSARRTAKRSRSQKPACPNSAMTWAMKPLISAVVRTSAHFRSGLALPESSRRYAIDSICGTFQVEKRGLRKGSEQDSVQGKLQDRGGQKQKAGELMFSIITQRGQNST